MTDKISTTEVNARLGPIDLTMTDKIETNGAPIQALLYVCIKSVHNISTTEIFLTQLTSRERAVHQSRGVGHMHIFTV